ncbi:TonB-dependent receptor [Lysobacter sp. CA199]|uniref:TonB-dependent receptor n=1 Tax=Lysobacter sp. CA199 TaxID=3455608 RepID=UPI003F8D4182
MSYPIDAARLLVAGSRADALALAVAMALLPCAAIAAPDADTDAAADATDLATVTVTARLGQESPKDIPFGLSVTRGADVEAGRLLDVQDVLRNSPGVEINTYGSANDANVRVRGVGSLNQVSMDDGSVVMSIDGVAMSARHASLATFDVDRIEVLKGPQGTLFGRNSEAGAINVTTRRPTREREGYVRLEAGEEGQHLEEAAVGGALSEQWSGRIAVRNAGSESWIDNANDGKPMIEPTEQAVRGSLLWSSGATSALFIAEMQEMKHKAWLELLRPFGDAPSLDFAPGVFDGNRKKVQRYSVEINHDLDNSRITSITARTVADFRGTKGYDRRLTQALYGMPMEYLVPDTSNEQVNSQDLRWSSLPSARVFWVAGLNLTKSERSFDSLYLSTGDQQLRDFTTDSYGIYGETTVPLADKLKLTAGLRYSWENKDYKGLYLARGASVSDARKLSEDFATGRVALSYEVTPTTNLYAVLARGYKPRGFNDYTTQVVDSIPYKAATVNTAELGFKHESADRRLQLSGAVYENKVRDDHLLGYDFNTMAVSAINADTRSRGAEFEGSWRFQYGLSLSGGLSYNDAKITSSALGVSGGDVAAGNRTPDVPHWSGSATVSYRRELQPFWGLATPTFNARLAYRNIGARPIDAQNHLNLAGYEKVDLRVGLETGNVEFYAWADNLLDERYDMYLNYSRPDVITGAPARGRTVGVGFRYAF